MKLVAQAFHFYINSSIHVALSVYSLTWITLTEYHLPYDENVLYFVFYATITGYNFVKYFGVAKFHHRSLTSFLKTIQVFSFFCFVLMCYYAFKLEKNTLIGIAVFGAVTFFYAIPFLPMRFFLDKQHNLRSIGGLKIYVIALVWSGVTVFLPLINNGFAIDVNVMLTGLQRYIFIIVLMFPFEIRDLRYDSLRLSTVPQKIGVKATKGIGVLLLLLFFFMEFFKDRMAFYSTFVLFVVSVVTGLFLIFSKEGQRSYYSAFWVEALPVFWLVLVLVFG